MFVRCPTCGTLLANKYIPFIKMMKENYKDVDWSAVYDIDNSEIIKKLKLQEKRYCCNYHLLCVIFKETLDKP
jgi:DNA-directed RNA polymerase subunit N (RpoN/RPB10)